MPDSSHDDRLLAWGLGTFHTSLFVLALVMFLFLRGSLGGLLAGLNTLAGFTLFGALWASTAWCTRRALRNIASQESGAIAILNTGMDFNRLAGQGLLWGAVNGALFFSVLVLFLLANLFFQPTALGSPDAFGLFFYLLLGGVVAAILGAVVGVLLAIIDSLLLFILRIIVRSIGMGKSR